MDRALTLMVVFFGGGIGCVLRLLIDGNTTNQSIYHNQRLRLPFNGSVLQPDLLPCLADQ